MALHGDAAAIAWATGVFEGEGSIVTAKNRRRGSVSDAVHVRISMTDPDVLERVRDAFRIGRVRGPYGPYKGYDKAHYKPTFVWEANGYQAVQYVSALMFSRLGQRRRGQVRTVLERARDYRSRKSTLCRNGHPYDETFNRGDGTTYQRCRQCRLAYGRKYEREQRKVGG